MEDFTRIATKIYLKRKRTGKSLEDGLAREIAKEIGWKTQDVLDELLAENLLERLEDDISSRLSRVQEMLWARAEDGDFPSMKFVLESHMPEVYDAGVRKQRIANEGMSQKLTWNPANIIQGEVIEYDPLLLEDEREKLVGEDGSGDDSPGVGEGVEEL